MPLSLLPTKDEVNMMLSSYDEAIQLYGIEAKLINIETINLYLDDRTLTNYYLPYKLLLQEYIDRRILNNLVWLNNEKGENYIVAFMPIVYLGNRYNIRVHQVVELYNSDLWQIAEISRSYLVGICYVVKLVPYVQEENRRKEEDQMKSNYTKNPLITEYE